MNEFTRREEKVRALPLSGYADNALQGYAGRVFLSAARAACRGRE